jgi:hypothetical protein
MIKSSEIDFKANSYKYNYFGLFFLVPNKTEEVIVYEYKNPKRNATFYEKMNFDPNTGDKLIRVEYEHFTLYILSELPTTKKIVGHLVINQTFWTLHRLCQHLMLVLFHLHVCNRQFLPILFLSLRLKYFWLH